MYLLDYFKEIVIPKGVYEISTPKVIDQYTFKIDTVLYRYSKEFWLAAVQVNCRCKKTYRHDFDFEFSSIQYIKNKTVSSLPWKFI